MDKEKILLHVCCAPCSAYVIEQVSKEFDVVLYFYNPNVHPEEEYVMRKDEVRAYADKKGIPYIEGDYDVPVWDQMTSGLEDEVEGGARCESCFDLRLRRTAQVARNEGIRTFATTLSVSPHKDADMINAVGSEEAVKAGLSFLTSDFKKNDGFRKTMAIAKEEKFYRQNYCGCRYSYRK